VLVIEQRHPVAVLRMEHGKANALDLELLTALGEALQGLEGEEKTRALVLTGRGSIFSAGVDLFRLVEGGADYVERFFPLLSGVCYDLFRFPRPVVAAVNGHAIAGGCILACACDYRVMARGGATLGVPELKVGVPFPVVALEILRFASSNAHLQELVYRGRTYTADEAWQRGLADETVEQEAVVERAVEVAAGLAAEPVERFRITKRQLRQPVLERIERLSTATDPEVLAAWKQPTTLEAIGTYLEGLRRR
jgi:enoyl-CoA hydratase